MSALPSLCLALLLALPGSAQEGTTSFPSAAPLSGEVRPEAAKAPDGAALEAPLQLPRLAWEDSRALVRQTWTPRERRLAWGGAALVFGSALALDRPLDRAVLGKVRPAWDRPARALEELGGTGALVIAGSAYLGGSLLDHPKLRAFGTDAGLSLLLTQVVFVLPGKYLLGRSRPSENRGERHFKPLRGGASFPSGHTANAFALAAVLQEHASEPWVAWASYSLAALVGLARMEQHHHFLSDALGGALLGTWVGRSVARHNRALRQGRVQIRVQPTFGPGETGLALRVGF